MRGAVGRQLLRACDRQDHLPRPFSAVLGQAGACTAFAPRGPASALTDAAPCQGVVACAAAIQRVHRHLGRSDAPSKARGICRQCCTHASALQAMGIDLARFERR